MPNTSNTNRSDITFIGSGIATSFTLIALLNEIKTSPSKQTSLKITIIEKGLEFHTGLAYGPTSGSSALLITSLADFLPDGPERKEFLDWLAINKYALIDELEHDGGDLSKNWIRTHADEIEANKWEDIYLPRHFFGVFIKEKVDELIKLVQNEGKIDISLVNDEVLEVDKNGDDSYSLKLRAHSNINTKKVVVSVGIPPIRDLWTTAEASHFKQHACLIANPYQKSLTDNLIKIEKFLEETKQHNANVLIVGANASAMEMIYKLNDVDQIKSRINTIIVVSPQGELPNSAQDETTRRVTFSPANLLSLNKEVSITALDIYNAASKDLDEAEGLGYGTAISEAPISKAFGALLQKLNDHELKEFACHYGNDIGKRQRRAGKHYTDVADLLKANNKLINISGYFRNLELAENQIYFSYKPKHQETNETYNKPVHIVLNCIGGKTLGESPITPLIDDLIKKELCVPNASMRGFEVDNNLQTQKGLYIAGPLLAGNLINNAPLWHIEHCGRIIYLGKILAKSLYSKINL